MEREGNFGKRSPRPVQLPVGSRRVDCCVISGRLPPTTSVVFSIACGRVKSTCCAWVACVFTLHDIANFHAILHVLHNCTIYANIYSSPPRPAHAKIFRKPVLFPSEQFLGVSYTKKNKKNKQLAWRAQSIPYELMTLSCELVSKSCCHYN